MSYRFCQVVKMMAVERLGLSSAVVNTIVNQVPKRSFATATGTPTFCTGASCPLSRFLGWRGGRPRAPAPLIGSALRAYSEQKPAKDDKHKKAQDSDSDSGSDSDSDTECKGKERSEFWRRKMRTFHALLDVNNDGVIAYDDFLLLAKRFQDLGNLDEQQAQEFRDVIKRTWEEQWGEITPYNLVTVEQYLADMHHVLNDKKMKKKAHNFLPYLFKAVDKDSSGFISVVEFKLFFKCLGLTEETAAVSFAIIDKNGDGKLSIKEFVKLGRDFFFTQDERKVSKMFWGPLVEH